MKDVSVARSSLFAFTLLLSSSSSSTSFPNLHYYYLRTTTFTPYLSLTNSSSAKETTQSALSMCWSICNDSPQRNYSWVEKQPQNNALTNRNNGAH